MQVDESTLGSRLEKAGLPTAGKIIRIARALAEVELRAIPGLSAEDRAARLGLESAAGVRMAVRRARAPSMRTGWMTLGLGDFGATDGES